jgi:hypothetical protein
MLNYFRVIMIPSLASVVCLSVDEHIAAAVISSNLENKNYTSDLSCRLFRLPLHCQTSTH